jgi:cytochrome P450
MTDPAARRRPGAAYESGIAEGTTGLAVTHAAMFDPQALSTPDDFDSTRGLDNQFHFGFDLHECLGCAIAQAMIPAFVQQSLRLNGLSAGRSIARMGRRRNPGDGA